MMMHTVADQRQPERHASDGVRRPSGARARGRCKRARRRFGPESESHASLHAQALVLAFTQVTVTGREAELRDHVTALSSRGKHATG